MPSRHLVNSCYPFRHSLRFGYAYIVTDFEEKYTFEDALTEDDVAVTGGEFVDVAYVSPKGFDEFIDLPIAHMEDGSDACDNG